MGSGSTLQPARSAHIIFRCHRDLLNRISKRVVNHCLPFHVSNFRHVEKFAHGCKNKPLRFESLQCAPLLPRNNRKSASLCTNSEIFEITFPNTSSIMILGFADFVTQDLLSFDTQRLLSVLDFRWDQCADNMAIRLFPHDCARGQRSHVSCR